MITLLNEYVIPWFNVGLLVIAGLVVLLSDHYQKIIGQQWNARWITGALMILIGAAVALRTVGFDYERTTIAIRLLSSGLYIAIGAWALRGWRVALQLQAASTIDNLVDNGNG